MGYRSSQGAAVDYSRRPDERRRAGGEGNGIMQKSDEVFIEERRRDLLRMQDDIRRTVEMNTQEFNDLLADISTEDFVAVANETQEKTTLGQLEITHWNRLRRISSALYRIDQGDYGVCLSCGGPIAEARLEALPDAPLCIGCETRRDAEERQTEESS
jgi:DnaK suppressor protein